MNKSPISFWSSVSSFSSLSSFSSALLDFIYPERCEWCERWMEGDRRGSFCAECWGRLIPIRPPWCAVCGLPFDGLRVGEVCGGCSVRERPPVAVWRYAGSYGDVLRKAIHVFKFQRRWRTTRALMKWFEERLVDEGGLADFQDVDWVVPIPLHPARLKERGVNHAGIVANRVARMMGKPVWKGLRRERPTLPQSELTRAERVVNVRKAFGVRSPEEVKGKTLLLVDDIVTTGATMEAAARVLHRAGARSVKVLALARTL